MEGWPGLELAEELSNVQAQSSGDLNSNRKEYQVHPSVLYIPQTVLHPYNEYSGNL